MQIGLAQGQTQSRVLGLLELRDAVQSSDEVKLHELAYSLAPANASNTTTDMYYGAMLLGAMKLNDLKRAEEIARLWETTSPTSKVSKNVRFALLSQGIGTQLEEAIALGESNVTNEKRFNVKLINISDLAILYLSVGEFDKAEKVLMQGESIVINEQARAGFAGVAAFWTPYSKAQYLRSRCIQQTLLFQYKKAEEFCLQSISSRNDADRYKRMTDLLTQLGVGTYQVQTYARLAEIYIKTGHYFDAENAIKKATDILASGQALGVAHAWMLEAKIQLAIAKKDSSLYGSLKDSGGQLSKSFNVGDANIGGILIHKYVQIALVTNEKWGNAIQDFDAQDSALINADAPLKQVALNIIPRSLTYLMNGRAVAAMPLLEKAYQQSAQNFGATHPQTTLLNGLRALTIAAMDSSQEARTLGMLDESVVALTRADNPLTEWLSQAERPIALRMIFEKYIELAGKSVNPMYSGRALGIADSLRTSSVQSAMNDAAVRASASTPALADLVRHDQDTKNELASLYNFISNRTGEVEAKRLESVMAQMKTRIAELEKSRAELAVAITKQFPEYSKLTHPTPPTITEIASKLKSDEALLTLLPTDKAVYVWAITQGAGGQAKQQFAKVNMDKAQLTALIKRLRASLDVAGLPDNRRPAFDHAAASEVYQKLLAPVAAGFAGKSSLIIAAGGALGQIPFGVLETQTSPQATPSKASTSSDSKNIALQNAPWLIKQAAITHVPSVAAWLSMRALPHHEAAQPMLAWGDPLFNIALASSPIASQGTVRKVDFTRSSTSVDLEKEDPRSAIKYANIPSLPETRDELTAIAKTLGANVNRDLILGSQATRQSVLDQNKNGNLEKQRVVAFATHGLMAGDLPNLTQPALAMAGTRDDATNVLAPLLTLEDVLTLKLNADWVVLSACNTAAADGKAEEALSGLARGFFYAGSRSLLVTHWSVESESAMQLTTETFKNYQSKPNEAKAESLRQAMLTVMSHPATAHPTYWAPYALVGDGAR